MSALVGCTLARMANTPFHHRALVHLAAAAAVGVAAGLATSATTEARFAPVTGWIAAGLVYLLWTWFVIWPMDADRTREHATADDPGRGLLSVVAILASIASIGGVGMLIMSANKQGGVLEALIGVVAVVVAWFVVPTLYTVRYADLYYSEDDDGIDWNREGYQPTYTDFAYLAFDMAETYQVSDTSISSPAIRRSVLGQSLLSYLLGAVVLASTINLVIQLASSGG